MITVMDPLSITAGAAGFISLGITAAGGIIQYCKLYRSQDVDFVLLMRHAKELESFLGSIKDRTTASQSPSRDVHNSLEGCRQACDACLNDFKQLNAKYTDQKSNRRLIYKLKYPFDKAKLDDLRSQLQEFHVRLLGILQLVNLWVLYSFIIHSSLTGFMKGCHARNKNYRYFGICKDNTRGGVDGKRGPIFSLRCKTSSNRDTYWCRPAGVFLPAWPWRSRDAYNDIFGR